MEKQLTNDEVVKLIEQINFSLLLLCIPDIKKKQAA